MSSPAQEDGFVLVRTYPRGRTCSHDGCTTPLSIYNPTRHCSVHQPEPDWRWLGISFGLCPGCGQVVQLRSRRSPIVLCTECRGRRASEPPVVPAQKKCRLCGRTKPNTEFFRDKTSRDGLDYRCKKCKAKATSSPETLARRRAKWAAQKEIA